MRSKPNRLEQNPESVHSPRIGDLVYNASRSYYRARPLLFRARVNSS